MVKRNKQLVLYENGVPLPQVRNGWDGKPYGPSQPPIQVVSFPPQGGRTPNQAPIKANVMRPTVIGGSVPNYFATALTTASRAPRRKLKRSAFSKETPASLQKAAGKQELLYLESLLHPERQIPTGIPDDFSYPFCPMALVSKYPITTDASGNYYMMIHPSMSYHTQYASSAAGVWAAPAYASVSQYSSVAATIRAYRPVSLGASFTCTLPALTASGEALVGVFGDPTNVLTATNVADIQQACIEWERCGLNSSAGCRAIWFPRSPVDRHYVAPGTTRLLESAPEGAAGQSQFGSSMLLFAFTGLPASTNIGFIETTFNIEGIPIVGDNFLTKMKSHKNTAVMDMVANVVSSSSQITPYESGKAKSKSSTADDWLTYLERGVQTATTVGSLLSKLPIF